MRIAFFHISVSSVPSVANIGIIPPQIRSFDLLPPAFGGKTALPLLTRPPFQLYLTACARMFCNAGGGLGWWWVLPAAGMAV